MNNVAANIIRHLTHETVLAISKELEEALCVPQSLERVEEIDMKEFLQVCKIWLSEE